MSIISYPPSRLPLRTHVFAALLIFLIVWLGGNLGLRYLEQLQARTQLELRDAIAKSDAGKVVVQIDPTRTFIDQFPNADRQSAVSRDLIEFAEQYKVQIKSLTQAAGPVPAPGLQSLQFNIAAQGDYPQLKSWLAELLGRYPTLAVQSLAFRARQPQGAGVDASLTFAFHFKG